MENIPTRLNNPGDLKDPSTGEFRQFDDSAQGYEALLNDLQGKITGNTKTGLGPNSTLVDFSKVWAPVTDNNDPGQYAANLATKMGVAPNATLGSLQPQIGKFAEAIASNEGFAQPESTPQVKTTSSSTTPNLDNWLWGLGGAAVAGIGGLLNEVAPVAKQVLPEVGAVAGSAFGPVGTAGGAAIGTGLASLIPGGESKTQPTTSSTTTQPTTSSASDLFSLEASMPEAQKNTDTLAQSLVKALQSTPTGRVLSQDKGVLKAIETGAKYGFAPSVVNGAMDFSEAQNKSKKTIGDLSDFASKALEGEGTVGNASEIKTKAKANLRKYSPVHEWETGDKNIDETVSAYAKEFGDKNGNIPLHQVQRIKQETGHGQKWSIADTTTKRAAFKAISSGARDTITNNTKNKEFYEAIMKEEQKLLNNQKIMKRLNGKKAPENAPTTRDILKQGGRVFASYIGDKIGGPVGAVIGYLVSKHVVNGIDEKFGRTIFETKGMQTALKELASHHPAVFKRIEAELKKSGWQLKEGKSEQRGLLHLEAPGIKMAPKKAMLSKYFRKELKPSFAKELAKIRMPGKVNPKEIKRVKGLI